MGILDYIKRCFSSQSNTPKIQIPEVDLTPPLSTIPDAPQGFGYKTSWLAIPAKSSETLIATLNFLEKSPANWETGILNAYNAPKEPIFISPPIDGWVFAVGIGLGAFSNHKSILKFLKELAQKIPNFCYFYSYRVTDDHLWALIENAKIKRVLSRGDLEGAYEEGDITEEEKELDMYDPLDDDQDDKECQRVLILKENTEKPDVIEPNTIIITKTPEGISIAWQEVTKVLGEKAIKALYQIPGVSNESQEWCPQEISREQNSALLEQIISLCNYPLYAFPVEDHVFEIASTWSQNPLTLDEYKNELGVGILGYESKFIISANKE